MQGRRRILVIEDDPVFRNLVLSLLRKDYLVSVAANGKSGLEKAIYHRPDLVIIDYQMPGWDGITTLGEFQNNPTFKTTKFVMLTADATKKTVMAAIQAGTDDYVIKSTFNKDVFLEKINKLLAPIVVTAVLPPSQLQSKTPGTGVASKPSAIKAPKQNMVTEVTTDDAAVLVAVEETTQQENNLPEKQQPTMAESQEQPVSSEEPDIAGVSDQENEELEIDLMMEDWE